MSRIDALIKRAKRLHGATSNEKLEAEWAQMCAGAKDELLALLESQIANDDDDETSVDEKLTAMAETWWERQGFDDEEFDAEAFTAMLDERVAQDKLAFFKNARRRRRPSLVY